MVLKDRFDPVMRIGAVAWLSVFRLNPVTLEREDNVLCVQDAPAI